MYVHVCVRVYICTCVCECVADCGDSIFRAFSYGGGASFSGIPLMNMVGVELAGLQEGVTDIGLGALASAGCGAKLASLSLQCLRMCLMLFHSSRNILA